MPHRSRLTATSYRSSRPRGNKPLVIGTELQLGNLSVFATILSKSQLLAYYSQRARVKRNLFQDVVVIIEDADVTTTAEVAKKSTKVKAIPTGPQPQDLLAGILQCFQGNLN